MEEAIVEDVGVVEESEESKDGNKKTLIVGLLVVLVLGVVTGGGLYYFTNQGKAGLGDGKATSGESLSKEMVKVGGVYGLKDDLFKDEAEGVVEANGSQGEGTHRLLREGGESQTAYLTSSVLDLDSFVGRRVKIWGQTFAAEKVGWLIDVGRVEVLE